MITDSYFCFVYRVNGEKESFQGAALVHGETYEEAKEECLRQLREIAEDETAEVEFLTFSSDLGSM